MTLTFNNSDTQLLTTAQPVLVGDQGATYIITAATVVNTDTEQHEVSVWRVPNGGSTSLAGTQIIDAQPVAAGETAQLGLVGQSLTNAATLQALADAADVLNLNLSWVQM